MCHAFGSTQPFPSLSLFYSCPDFSRFVGIPLSGNVRFSTFNITHQSFEAPCFCVKFTVSTVEGSSTLLMQDRESDSWLSGQLSYPSHPICLNWDNDQQSGMAEPSPSYPSSSARGKNKRARSPDDSARNSPGRTASSSTSLGLLLSMSNLFSSVRVRYTPGHLTFSSMSNRTSFFKFPHLDRN